MGDSSLSSEKVAESISKLSGPNAKEREQAAYELFRLGCASAEPALMKWFADPEFRALVPRAGVLLTVGLAVWPATFEAIRTRFGQLRLAEVPSDQDVLEFELSFAHAVRLDVLTPATDTGEGAIAKFLARFGEGIQQVECDVCDVGRAVEILRQRFQLQPIYPEVRTGANQTKVNFFLVPVAEGRKLLMELVESPRKSKAPQDVKKSTSR